MQRLKHHLALASNLLLLLLLLAVFITAIAGACYLAFLNIDTRLKLNDLLSS